MTTIVNGLLLLLAIYLVLGFFFSLVFIFKGLVKVDPSTEGTSIWFKMLILPGLCAFWPLFFTKWRKAARS